MLNDDYYAICLDDPAVPPFCSFPKQYIGCEEDLLTLADNLDRDGVYPKTAAGIRSYFAGNTGVTHVIAPTKCALTARMSLRSLCATRTRSSGAFAHGLVGLLTLRLLDDGCPLAEPYSATLLCYLSGLCQMAVMTSVQSCICARTAPSPLPSCGQN